MNTFSSNCVVPEETLFWTEEVEAELSRWDEEKFKLAEVKTDIFYAKFTTFL